LLSELMGMVGDDGFISGVRQEEQVIGTNELLESSHGRTFGQEVKAILAEPEVAECCVIDEHGRCARRVGAVFEIGAFGVEKQDRAIEIEGDGGKVVIVALDDERARRRGAEDFSE